MNLFRDSWEAWRRKVDEALHGAPEPIESKDVVYDNTGTGLSATNVQNAINEVLTSSQTTSQQLSTRIGLQKITFYDGAGSIPTSNVELMIQRLPNDPYIRLIVYMHDSQNTRYVCRFNSVEVVTN